LIPAMVNITLDPSHNFFSRYCVSSVIHAVVVDRSILHVVHHKCYFEE
jgi:hypothetical protein